LEKASKTEGLQSCQKPFSSVSQRWDPLESVTQPQEMTEVVQSIHGSTECSFWTLSK